MLKFDDCAKAIIEMNRIEIDIIFFITSPFKDVKGQTSNPASLTVVRQAGQA
jgi:hypothetical protein